MKSLTDIRTQMNVSDPAEDSRARVRQQQADILSALQTGNNVGDKLLATGMMGQVQGFENVRRGLAGLNPAFRSEAEVLDDALKGIDTTTPNGQRQALEIVRRISPGKAMALATEFDDRNKAVLDNMPRYQVGSESYANGVRVDNTDQGQIIVRQNGRVIKDPAEANRLIKEGQIADINLASQKAEAEAEAPAFVAQQNEYTQQINSIVNSVDQMDRMKELFKYHDAAVGYQSFMPEFFQNAATQELNKIYTEMGLGVIAAGKFGALSESEMKVAMTANLPARFRTKEAAIEFIESRQAAKIKLANELNLYKQFIASERMAGRKYSDKLDMKKRFNEIRAAQTAQQNADDSSSNPTPGLTETDEAELDAFMQDLREQQIN